jgi:hypothetical protein
VFIRRDHHTRDLMASHCLEVHKSVKKYRLLPLFSVFLR